MHSKFSMLMSFNDIETVVAYQQKRFQIFNFAIKKSQTLKTLIDKTYVYNKYFIFWHSRHYFLCTSSTILEALIMWHVALVAVTPVGM